MRSPIILVAAALSLLSACDRQTLLLGVNPPGAAVVPLVNRGPLGQPVPVPVGEALEDDGLFGLGAPRGRGTVREASPLAGPPVVVPDPEPLGPLPSEVVTPQTAPEAIIYDDVPGSPVLPRPAPVDPVAARPGGGRVIAVDPVALPE